MLRVVIILSILFTWSLAAGQDCVHTGDTQSEGNTAVHTRMGRMVRADSPDTALTKTSANTTTSDTLKKIIHTPTDAINQLQSSITSKKDSLLNRLNYPSEDLDDEVEKTSQSLQDQIDGAGEKVDDKVNGVQGNLQGGVNTATNGELQLPTENLNMPETESGLEGILPRAKPANKTGDATQPGVENLNVPDVNLDGRELTEKANINMEGVDKVTNEINAIDSKLQGAKKYEEEFKNIKDNGIQDAEKLPETIENKVGEVEEIKMLNEKTQLITDQQKQYNELLQKYKDKKLMKEELLRKSKNIANDKLNQYSPEFKEAQEQYAKTKKLNPAVKSAKEISKKRPNEMKGKPFKYRFIPGAAFQVYNGHQFIMDNYLNAGYKLSGRWLVGAGYSYRISLSKYHTNFVRSEGISGYRVYSDFTLLKGIYAHAEFDALKLSRAKQPLLRESDPDRVYGSYFGLGKRYNITKSVKGSIMGLYRVNYKGEVPGLSKLNLRISFDWVARKDRKKLLVPGTSKQINLK